MRQYIASIDQGTTSTRCILFDTSGRVVAQAQKEHRQIFPQPGWVEHDPLEILARVQETLDLALDRAGKTLAEVAAVGITNQRETTVIWNRFTGKPYCNAIVWQDTRTAEICDKLAIEGGQDRFRRKTGLPLATYFSGPKLQWALSNIPNLRKDAEGGKALFGTVDSWLIWNLTGGPNGGIHVTDATNASRTLLMNLQSLEWDDEILEILAIPKVMLPTIKSSSEIYGPFIKLGGVPIASALGDQQAALFGQACYQPGDAKNTYGTGCFMLLNTGNDLVPSKNGLLTTVGYKIGNFPTIYCLEGSIAIAGALVQWLRDNLQLINQSSDIEALAKTTENNGGAYIVPAFSGLFAPYWRSDARGVIVGLTGFINRGHIARAALESTAYQTREVFDAMESDSGVELTSLKVDGGMVMNELLMQFQADILNVPVVRPRITETTALGAAYAAGLAVGIWRDLNELRELWSEDRSWSPSMPESERRRLYSGWKKAVTRSFDWMES